MNPTDCSEKWKISLARRRNEATKKNYANSVGFRSDPSNINAVIQFELEHEVIISLAVNWRKKIE